MGAALEIHGLRIYPQSVEVVRGDGGPIFVHGRVSEDCSDFYYIFRPLAPSWRGHVFADSFGVSLDENFVLEDPLPGLRQRYGPSLLDAELDGQLMLLLGDDFASWGSALHPFEGAFLPIFRTPPTFDLARRVYWGRDVRLTSDTWPGQLRAVLHMWDDIYWQLFTTDRSDIDVLLRTHAGDPKLKMYHVEFDREYPDPSNGELRPATRPDGS